MDASRITVTKERAMLQIRNFKKTRHLIDWIVNYMSDLRRAVSSLEAFQGRTAGQTVKHVDDNKIWKAHKAAGASSSVRHDTKDETVLVLRNDQRSFSETPCKGCGAPFQHRQPDKPAIAHDKSPFRNHPDWNSENVEFCESAAGKRMSEHRSPFVTSKGELSASGGLMNRLSTFYRAMMDVGGVPMKLDPPLRLMWPSQGPRSGAHSTGTYIEPKRPVEPIGK
jgi:hypothetical protein